MNATDRAEVIEDILVLLQTQAKYPVWLPSTDVLNSIDDLLSRQAGLSDDRVIAFMAKLEYRDMGMVEICDLMVDEVVAIFKLTDVEAKIFVDGLDYIIEKRRLENYSDAELLKRRTQAVRDCVSAEEQEAASQTF